jgi:glycosyltransferase involved in cell wall biosynthesis
VFQNVTETQANTRVVANVGVVAIGRNEGKRLEACLISILSQVSRVVYVDSGSSDGSVAYARSVGVEVVEVDRGRNRDIGILFGGAGVRRNVGQDDDQNLSATSRE